MGPKIPVLSDLFPIQICMALSNKKIISFQILQLAPTKKIFLVFISTCLLFAASAQSQWPRFSIATDVNSQHSFTKDQQFWAVGHTIIANFHLTSKDGIYVWFGYNVGGKFSNQLTAVAKLPATNPQQRAKAAQGFGAHDRSSSGQAPLLGRLSKRMNCRLRAMSAQP